MKVKSVKINIFRHISDVEMKFGSCITAIAGQNGTGKSSILGLIGHIFTFSKGEIYTRKKTLLNKRYETLYSEIFKFSYPKYDKPKQHDYVVNLDDDDEVPVLSYERKEKGKPTSLRFRVRKS